MKSANDAVIHVAGAIRAQLDSPITTAVPQFPACESVRGRVLGRLLRGRMMTNGDVWRELSASRLAATVYQLRHEFGWDIRSHRIRVRTRDNGRDALISEYWIDAEQRNLAGERGQKYAAQTVALEERRHKRQQSFLELPTQARRESRFGRTCLSEFHVLVDFATEIEMASDLFPVAWCRMGALAMMRVAAARIEPVNRLTDESLNFGD